MPLFFSTRRLPALLDGALALSIAACGGKGGGVGSAPGAAEPCPTSTPRGGDPCVTLQVCGYPLPDCVAGDAADCPNRIWAYCGGRGARWRVESSDGAVPDFGDGGAPDALDGGEGGDGGDDGDGGGDASPGDGVVDASRDIVIDGAGEASSDAGADVVIDADFPDGPTDASADATPSG